MCQFRTSRRRPKHLLAQRDEPQSSPNSPAATSGHGAKRQRGSPLLLFSAIRKVAKCPEYRHVVPGHPPLCDLSSFDAEHSPEIELRLATRGWERAHWSLLRALIRGPCSDEIPFSNQKLDRLHRIGKNRCILP